MVNPYYFGIEELDERHHCPGCGMKFVENEWEDIGGYHYRSGGETRYKCPVCEEHTITVTI